MENNYTQRLNRVIDYINEHITEELELDTLALVAALSKYHFHRIFSSMVGEPLGSYINRLRLEKAAAQINGAEGRPITDVAMDLGFSSSAVFSRSFKRHFGTSPLSWRNGDWQEYSKFLVLTHTDGTE